MSDTPFTAEDADKLARGIAVSLADGEVAECERRLAYLREIGARDAALTYAEKALHLARLKLGTAKITAGFVN